MSTLGYVVPCKTHKIKIYVGNPDYFALQEAAAVTMAVTIHDNSAVGAVLAIKWGATLNKKTAADRKMALFQIFFTINLYTCIHFILSIT